MPQTRRISITLNPRQIAEAQVIAALETIGGSATNAIIALALRGIMSDPSMSTVLARGVALTTHARAKKGNGWQPGTLPKVATAARVISRPDEAEAEPTMTAPPRRSYTTGLTCTSDMFKKRDRSVVEETI